MVVPHYGTCPSGRCMGVSKRSSGRFRYSDMQIRYGPELPPIGGSRPSPFFASPTTDVRKGFRMNLLTH